MPLYEYQCRDCRRDFEVLVRGSEPVTCPVCGQANVEKQLSVVAAPSHSAGNASQSLPEIPMGGCGRPACASGGCQGFMD